MNEFVSVLSAETVEILQQTKRGLQSADCIVIWLIQFCYSVEHLWELVFKIVPVKFKHQFTSFYVILRHSSVKVIVGLFRHHLRLY